MKFIIQLVANFLRAMVTSCQKLLSLHKLNFVDLCVFCTTVFLAVGYYYPWCLIVAFVCMLPPLQEQLYLPDDQGAASKDGKQQRELTLEEELQARLQREEEALARELAGGGASHSQSLPSSDDEQGTGQTFPSPHEQKTEAVRARAVSSPESAKGARKREKAERKVKRAAEKAEREKERGAEKPRVGRSLWGLPTLRVRDHNGTIVEINSEKPVPIETDFFKGTILIMMRTDGDMEQYNRYDHHFQGKQRKFEVQFQGGMTNVPSGEVMLGGELPEKMDISFVTRTLLSVFTKFFMALNPFLHFGFGETPKSDNLFELPHLTFPLFRVMDRVIVTPPGGELPQLGQELKEEEQQRKERRAGKGVTCFKEGYTYSFSFHSMYTDFSRWSIVNFPGYKAIDIGSFFGRQHINVIAYAISEKDLMATGKAQHYNAHKQYLLTLELKHETCMSPEELAEADREEKEEVAGGISDSEESDDDDDDSEDDSRDDSEDDSDEDESTTDGELHGDDMDEESIAIAREMTKDQRDFQQQDREMLPLSPDGGLLHVPDDSELIPGGAVVSLIAIPAPWEPWEKEQESQEKSLEREDARGRRELHDLDMIDIDPRDGLSALRPPTLRSEGSRIMHGNATTHEDSGLSPKRTCFGVADVGGVAMRKECAFLPSVRFLPVTPPHISTSRLARLSLRRSGHHASSAGGSTPPSPRPRKSMLSSLSLYSRRRNTSHAEKHSTITPHTTAATDASPPPAGLRCGDAVQLQSASTGRYLTVHKGWWLGWTSEEYQESPSSKQNRIASKVLFTLHPTDSTGLKYMPQGTPLVAGMPFRLRSVRWPDWEVGCCEPSRQGGGSRESAVVLYYAKIKVRGQVPTSGPVKWHNSSKKVNPLCLSVMHEESGGGMTVVESRRRSLSASSSDLLSSPRIPHAVSSGTGFESHVQSALPTITGPKRLFGVSPTRIVNMTRPSREPISSGVTGINVELKDDSPPSNVSTGSILTQFLAPLDIASCGTVEDRSELTVTVSGWAEVLNRSLNYSQLAYIITVSYKGGDDATQASKWTTLRTQEDLEEIFAQIEQEQEQQQCAHKGRVEEQEDLSKSLSPCPGADRSSIQSVSDGEAGGYVSSSSDAKGRLGGGVQKNGKRDKDKDQWSIVDRDEEDRLAEGGDRLRRQQHQIGDDKGASDSGGATPSRLQRAKRSVLRRSRVNIQRHDIAPNHLYPADQNVLIMTNRILKALNSGRGSAGGAGALSDPSSKTKKFDSTDSLMSFEDQDGNKTSPVATSRSLVRRTSLDDGSGTRQQDRNSSEDTGKSKHQSLSLKEYRQQLSILQGYLSDSSAAPARQGLVEKESRFASPLQKDGDEPNDTTIPTTETLSSSQIAKKAFLVALSAPQILDTWFLSEDSDKYLRAPPPHKTKKAPAAVRQQVTIVARALWDSHWREEIAVVFPAYINFYPLLAKKASWTLHLQELIGISHVDEATSPLPGFSILRIETVGRLHYLAFSSKESCSVMAAAVLEHLSEITFDGGASMPPAGGEVGDPRDRFVLKSGRWRPAGRRLILNARKFLFDVENKSKSSLLPGGSGPAGSSFDNNCNQQGTSSSLLESAGGTVKIDFSASGPEPYWRFAERLLRDVFRLELGGGSTSDAEGLFPGREVIISFLDETVKLKQINLQKDVDFSSPEALCFFTNIYHTLLMHARLVLGPPNSQEWSNFFDTVCYEIGSDVFSLCEIEHCVLGGRLARPQTTPRHFAPVPRANDDHYLYALPAADRRMRFLVNYGSLSLLPTLYLMTPETMHQSLNEASIAFFESSMVVDMKKRTVTLPKICDTFGLDFGEDALGVLRHILRYLNRDNWEKISILLSSSGGKAPTVKFQDLKPRSHTRLHLVVQK